MGMYQGHAWSAGTWVLMMVGMIVFLLALTGVFLVGVGKACQATSPRREEDQQAEPGPPVEAPTTQEQAVPEEKGTPALSG